MNGNFYSNDLLVKIQVDERMAEAEAYRRVTQVERSAASAHPARRSVFHSFGWIRRLVVRIAGAGA